MWLRLACLTVSVGLHAGLGALGWQNLASLSVDDGPMTVALVERPLSAAQSASLPAPAGPRAKAAKASLPRRSPSRPSAATVATPPVSEQPVEPLCVAPEAAVVEAFAETASDSRVVDSHLPSGEGVASGGGAGIDGAGAGDGGAARGDRRGDGGERGGLIRATPRYESNPLPNYPRLARQNRWEGTVRLRARVTAGGSVEGVSLERSSGHAVLDNSALDGVKRWRFIPATRGGVPVACEVSIPVAFRLTE